MDISTRIAQRKNELNLTLDDIAKATGVARSTAGKWVNGNIKDMRIDKLENLASVLQTTIDWLLGRNEDYTLYDNVEKIPVPTEISVLCETIKEKEKSVFVKAPEYINADVAVRFCDDSMINARIFAGDVVFISSQETVDNGDICAIIIDKNVYLRRIYIYKNRIELRPENPLYEVMNFEDENRNKVKIIGKAIAFLSGIR